MANVIGCLFVSNTFAYTTSISTTGTVNIDVATSNNSASLGTDTVNIVSTCPSGYTVSITGPTNNSLYLGGDSTSTHTITASTGTVANPVSILGNNLGTWGYTTDANATINSNFIGLTSTETLLASKATASATGGDTINVFFGVSVTPTTAPGNYTLAESSQGAGDNTITYALVPSISCFNYTVHFDANSGTGTMQDQPIPSGTPTALTPNSFTAPTGKSFKNWNTQPDGSGTSYDDEDVVTDIATSGTTITLYAQWQTGLYDIIASKRKGTQTAAELRTTISKTNSGIYTYDSSAFGPASDASNDYTIYYYRGILDNTTGSYGSDGDGAAWPNYVRLGNTCWRIFRTTGSGGIKMIYNGLWTGTTCANTQTNAQVTSTTYGSQAGSNQATNWTHNVHRAGYTYNATVDDSTTTTSVDTVFGNNSNYSTTNATASSIKTYLENTWFTSTNGVSAYESILEPSAGYCNDRSVFSNEAGTTAITNIAPYASSVAYFGAYTRHKVANANLTLSCTRGTVDIYSTSSASDGNKQLSKPVALITTDEAALSGNGYGNTNTYSYNANSFLRTGSNFWTFSPRYRRSDGSLRQYSVGANGAITGTTPNESAGVRPVISLQHGTAASSGTGTATDPWIVDAP